MVGGAYDFDGPAWELEEEALYVFDGVVDGVTEGPACELEVDGGMVGGAYDFDGPA